MTRVYQVYYYLNEQIDCFCGHQWRTTFQSEIPKLKSRKWEQKYHGNLVTCSVNIFDIIVSTAVNSSSGKWQVHYKVDAWGFWTLISITLSKAESGWSTLIRTRIIIMIIMSKQCSCGEYSEYLGWKNLLSPFAYWIRVLSLNFRTLNPIYVLKFCTKCFSAPCLFLYILMKIHLFHSHRVCFSIKSWLVLVSTKINEFTHESSYRRL